MTQNDIAWDQLFKKYHIMDSICEKGVYIISADQIREFREPRLMTKFDHKINLPSIFSENKLSILPISRGDYVIATFSAYADFLPSDSHIERVSVPSYLQSLIPQFIFSESIALNCAYSCGVLSSFLEDDEILPTVSGRMGSGTFDFSINTLSGNRTLSVNNSQVEIDAAYEGVNFLSLVEAKLEDLSEDFLIRQLYYPFRIWKDRIAKPIKTIFLRFSNGVFSLYQYQFENPQDYNSLCLIKQEKYMIATKITLSDIERILKNTPLIHEPKIPFPQANSMPRLINLLGLLYDEPLTKSEITHKYAFDDRQTDYYTNAGRYLNLIEKYNNGTGNIAFRLSPLGNQVMKLEYKERQLAIITQIVKHKIFRDILTLHLQSGEMPDTQTIIEAMNRSDLYNIDADSTFFRRSSTITGWINWILSVIEE